MEVQYVEQCDASFVDIKTSRRQLDNMAHSLVQQASSYLCTFQGAAQISEIENCC